jgi:hypothetical protein
MALCSHTGSTSVPSFTTEELRASFSGGLLPSSLPTMENGLATANEIQNQISNLVTQGKLPTPPTIQRLQKAPFGSPDSNNPLLEYVTKSNTVDDTLKNEYCFYEGRYFTSLNNFLTSLGSNSLGGDQNSIITGHLDMTRTLNKKLTYLTQLANAIAKKRYEDTQGFQTDINSSNTNIISQQEKLLKQRDILSKETASADLYKRMVEYTTEKNRANQNLLVMYGILNVTALAMIFYVARS